MNSDMLKELSHLAWIEAMDVEDNDDSRYLAALSLRLEAEAASEESEAA